jgi:hypothetical protein
MATVRRLVPNFHPLGNHLVSRTGLDLGHAPRPREVKTYIISTVMNLIHC